MEFLKKTSNGLLIAIGLLLLGLCLKSGIESFTSNDRIVSVRGLAEREVKADKVTWPIISKEVGNNPQQLYEKINQTNEQIVKFLTDNGISPDEIAINAPSIIDLEAERYSYEQRPYRYNVSSVITVTSPNVDKVTSLIKRQGELLEKGIAVSSSDWQAQPTYEFTNLNNIKPEMIAEATQKAREAGEKFAEDSQSELGKIKQASQGQFSIEDRDAYTPDIKTVRVVTTIIYYLED